MSQPPTPHPSLNCPPLQPIWKRYPLPGLPTPWQPYGYLLIISLPLLLLRSSQQSLMAHDEGVYAGQALDILRSGNWINPTSFVYDRTLGMQWVIALAYHLFGVGEGIARLPSTLACLVSIGLTYRLGAMLLGQTLGFLGAIILSLTHLWIQYGRLATQDMSLVCLELLGFWALLEAGRCAQAINTLDNSNDNSQQNSQQNHTQTPHVKSQSRHHHAWLILAGSTVGLAFFIKGFMVLPVAVAVLPYLIATEAKHRTLRRGSFYLGLILGFLPVGFWLGVSIATYGSLAPLQGLVGKLSTLSQERYLGAGPAYYLWNVPVNSFPWFIFSGWGTWILVQRLRQARSFLPFGGFWLLGVYPWLLLGELTLFATRTRYYPLQLLPCFSLLAALGLARWLAWYGGEPGRPGSDLKRVGWVLILMAGGLGLGLTLAGVGLLGAIVLAKIPLENWRYGVLALAWGVPWVGMGGMALGSRNDRSRPMGPWLGSLLLGPWLTIALLGATGLWGNYNPKLKTFLEQPTIETLNQTHMIHRLRGENLTIQQRKTGLLLNFYTQNPGQALQHLDQLSPGAYGWISDAISLEDATISYQVLGEIQGWKLIQRSSSHQGI